MIIGEGFAGVIFDRAGIAVAELRRQIEVAGKPLILWSIDSLDWESRDAQSVYDIVKDSHYDGAIILMHDLYESTAEATEMVVPMLAEAGYKMVTVSEMAKAYGISLRDGATYFDMVMEG